MKYDLEQLEQLVIDYLAGTISPEEEAFLKKAMEEDSEVAVLFKDYSTSLALSQYGTNEYGINEYGANEWNKEAAWQKVIAATGKENKSKVVPITAHRKKRFPTWMAISAAACLLLVVGSYVLFFKKGEPIVTADTKPYVELTLAGGEVIRIEKGEGTIETSAAEFRTDSNSLQYAIKGGGTDTVLNTLSVPEGLDYAISLDDGSRVWVNAATKIKFPLRFPAGWRKIELEGEAYFEVAKDKIRPFIVHTNDMDVQVYGTSFNIKAYPNETVQTSLVEGRVEARSKGIKVMLLPGKAAALVEGILKETSFNEKVVLAWRKGFYFFQNESISSINFTVQRWFGHRFEYADGDIANIRFSGALEKIESLPSFLSRICSSANLSYEIKGDAVILKRIK